MADWRGYKLNDLAALDGPVLEASLASIRAWTDASSPVGPSVNGPDGRRHCFREAEDLLYVPSDRRDGCFAELATYARWLRAAENDPTEFIRGVMASGQAPHLMKFDMDVLSDAARGTGAVSRVSSMWWTDDGKNDTGKESVTLSFT